MKRRKNQGWKYEPYRHSLASQGIKTTQNKIHKLNKNKTKKPPNEIYPIDWEKLKKGRDYFGEELDKMFLLFWWSDYHDIWDFYDWNESLEILKKKCENFINHWIGKMPKDFSEFINIIEEKNIHQRIENELIQIYRAYKYIDEAKKSEYLSEKIYVMEEIIHLSHQREPIVDVIIPCLRKEFKEKYL